MFSAILIEKTDDKQSVSLAQVDEAQLPEGDVTIDVELEPLASLAVAEGFGHGCAPCRCL